jgi:hypothetical protein
MHATCPLIYHPNLRSDSVSKLLYPTVTSLRKHPFDTLFWSTLNEDMRIFHTHIKNIKKNIVSSILRLEDNIF